MSKIYAMYKGEKCLGIGNIIQLSKQLKIKYKTLLFYKTPTYKKRLENSKNRRELILIDD